MSVYGTFSRTAGGVAPRPPTHFLKEFCKRVKLGSEAWTQEFRAIQEPNVNGFFLKPMGTPQKRAQILTH